VIKVLNVRKLLFVFFVVLLIIAALGGVAMMIASIMRTGLVTASNFINDKIVIETTIAAPENIDITYEFPDPNFRAAIRNVLEIGEEEAIMSSDVAAVTELDLVEYGYYYKEDREFVPAIYDLTGLDKFINLKSLDCSYNRSLTSLPPLPENLEHLEFNYCFIKSLPPLPDTLLSISCYYGRLESFPDLPDSLIYINCARNPVTYLPELPDSLEHLEMYLTSVTTLPTLPNSLKYLNVDSEVSPLVFEDGTTPLERQAAGTLYFVS
jgi:hypothetical protein